MTNWPRLLDPLLDSPIATPIILQEVVLTAGKNVIDHRLGKDLVGYISIGNNGPTTLWSDQANNPLPSKNLWLMASSGVTVNLLVF